MADLLDFGLRAHPQARLCRELGALQCIGPCQGCRWSSGIQDSKGDSHAEKEAFELQASWNFG